MRKEIEMVIEKINECMKDENIYSNKEMLEDFSNFFIAYAQFNDFMQQIKDTYLYNGDENIEECGYQATDEIERITGCMGVVIGNIERNDSTLCRMAKRFDNLRNYYSDDMKLYKEMKSMIEKE